MRKTIVKIMTFVKVEVGKSLEVIAQLQKIPEVQQISYITGEYDLMFILAADNTETINRKFLEEIDQFPLSLKVPAILLLKNGVIEFSRVKKIDFYLYFYISVRFEA